MKGTCVILAARVRDIRVHEYVFGVFNRDRARFICEVVTGEAKLDVCGFLFG